MPRSLAMVLFGLLWTALQVGIHYYLWRRLVRDTGMRPPWRRFATFAIVALGLSVPLTMWGSRAIDPLIGRVLGWPSFLWLTVSGLSFFGLALADLGRFLGWSARRAARRRAPVDAGRRQFLARAAGGAVFAAAAGATASGVREALSDIEVREVPIVIPRLPAALDGFRIAQLTDLHIGFTIGRGYVQDLVDRTNALEPDLVALTGDLVDGRVEDIGHAFEPLGRLRSPHGTYSVTGNHEYYAGVEPWLALQRELGIRVLRNERVRIGDDRAGFDLAGIDDHSAGRFGADHGPDLERALAGRDRRRALVLLAHQPRQVRVAERHDVDLQLSGHTHGGQVWPWHYLAMAQQGGLLAGLSRHRETWLYISRGCGYWGPPVRVGAPAELTVIRLRAGV